MIIGFYNLYLFFNLTKNFLNIYFLDRLGARRIAYIDEAQDCHPLERDILFSIFGSNNIVIANGGKEQLIRYSQLCDWHISRSQKIESHKYQKRRKSYRMKPAIAALANHIATWYKIDLDIEQIDTEDHGSVLIDFSKSS